MADEADIAADLEEVYLDLALRKARKNASEKIPDVKHCFQCGSETEKGRRWCDAHCRDQWEMGNT